MTFPTQYTVGWHTADLSGMDAEGNPATSWTTDLDEAGVSVAVMGWAPARAAEPEIGRVEHDIDLYVPTGTTVGAADVVDLPNGQFEVVGEALDWSTGPFVPGFGGVVVQLKRVTG